MDSRDTNHNQMNFIQFNGADNREQQHQSFMYQELGNYGKPHVENQQTLEHLQQAAPVNLSFDEKYYMNTPTPNQSSASSFQFNCQNNPSSNYMQQVHNTNNLQANQQFNSQDNFVPVSQFPVTESQTEFHENVANPKLTIQSHEALSNISQLFLSDDFADLVEKRLRSSNTGKVNTIDSDVPFIDLTENDVIITKNYNNPTVSNSSGKAPNSYKFQDREMNTEKLLPKCDDQMVKQIFQPAKNILSESNTTEEIPNKTYTQSSNGNSKKRLLAGGSNFEQLPPGSDIQLQKKLKINDDFANTLTQNKNENDGISFNDLSSSSTAGDRNMDLSIERVSDSSLVSNAANIDKSSSDGFDSDMHKNITTPQADNKVLLEISMNVPSSQTSKPRSNEPVSEISSKTVDSPLLASSEKAKEVDTTNSNMQTVVPQNNKKDAEFSGSLKTDKDTDLGEEKIINTPWRSLDDFRYISTDEHFEATTNVLYKKMCQLITGEHELKLLILSVINSCCLANDLPKLMTRLCMILMAFGRASYGKKPDWRFVALKSIQDMREMFEKSNNNVIDFQSDYLKKNKMFMRVSNWLRFDMSHKAYTDILKSLEFLKSVGLDRESLEYYKILPVLKKVLTFEDQKDLVNITKEILQLSIPKKKQILTTKVSNDSKNAPTTAAGSNNIVSSKTVLNNPKKSQETITNKSSATKIKNKVESQKQNAQSTSQSSMFMKFLPNKYSEKKDEAIGSTGVLSSTTDVDMSSKLLNTTKSFELSKQSMPNTLFSRFLPSKQQEKKTTINNKSDSITDSSLNADSDKDISVSPKVSSALFARFLPSKNEDKSVSSDSGSNANDAGIVEVEENAPIDPRNGLKSILRRQKDTSKTIRKRRNVSVKWKDDNDLVSVKLFDSDDFDRNLAQENIDLHEPEPKLVQQLPVESDQEIEWYEPIAVDFNNISWCPFVEENSTSRGGAFKIESEENDIQEKREAAIGEVVVDSTTQSPREPPDNGIGGMVVTNSNGLTLNTKIMVPF